MNIPAVTASIASTTRHIAESRRRAAEPIAPATPKPAAPFLVLGLPSVQRSEATTFGAAAWRAAEAAGRGDVRAVACIGARPAPEGYNPACAVLGFAVEWSDDSRATLLVVAKPCAREGARDAPGGK